MAEQPTGTVESPAHGVAAAYDPAHLKHSSGRPISWVGTTITIIERMSFSVSVTGASKKRTSYCLPPDLTSMTFAGQKGYFWYLANTSSCGGSHTRE